MSHKNQPEATIARLLDEDSHIHAIKIKSLLTGKIVEPSNITISHFLEAININGLNSYLKKYGYCTIQNSPIFFRGQADAKWDPIPGIFRDDNLQSNEHDIINEILSNQADEFKHDKTTFEKLVRMQHFGVPTRLLDITRNPLVALYFATQPHVDEQDGAIFIYYKPECNPIIANFYKTDEGAISDIFNFESFITLTKQLHYSPNIEENLIEETIQPNKRDKGTREALTEEVRGLLKNSTKYVTSNIISITSNLSLLTSQNKHELSKLINDYKHELETLSNNIPRSPAEIAEKLKSIEESYYEKYPMDILVNHIQGEKPFFEQKIKISSLVDSIITIPPNTNKRLIAQQGAFVTFGFHDPMTPSDVSRQIVPLGMELIKIIIPAAAKENLRRELDFIGINGMTLFPDLENAADYIKEKYGFS